MGPQQPTLKKSTKKSATPASAQSKPKRQKPKKRLGKGAVLGIVFGSIGLVLVIAGIILAIVLLSGPSKADYDQAYAKTKAMNSTYADIDLSDKFDDAKTAADIDTIVDELKKQYDKDNSELAGMKALRDKDVKTAFDNYKQKYDAAIPYLRISLKSSLQLKGVSSACGYSSLTWDYSAEGKQAVLDSFDAKSKTCVNALKELEKSDSEAMQKFAKQYLSYIDKYRTYIGDYAEAVAKSDYSSLSDLKYPSSSDIPSASSLLSESQKELEKYDFESAFSDLMDILKDKTNDA